MVNDLSMGNNQVKNLAEGTSDKDAVDLSQLAKSHISSVPNRENVFKYIMEGVDESESDRNVIIESIDDTEFPTPHKIKKRLHNENNQVTLFKSIRIQFIQISEKQQK